MLLLFFLLNILGNIVFTTLLSEPGGEKEDIHYIKVDIVSCAVMCRDKF